MVLNLEFDKNKLYKTLRDWSRDMLNCNFQKKGLGLVSLPHFVYDFPRKMLLMFYSFNWPNFIVWLPLWDVGQYVYYNGLLTSLWRIKLEINLIFLIKLFCYLTKKSRQKFKYLDNEKSFLGELKTIFHHFKRAINFQKLSQAWECAFNFQEQSSIDAPRKRCSKNMQQISEHLFLRTLLQGCFWFLSELLALEITISNDV